MRWLEPEVLDFVGFEPCVRLLYFVPYVVLERRARGTRWRGTRMVTIWCATSTTPALPMLSVSALGSFAVRCYNAEQLMM
jgi:hypothetical protein